MNRLNWPGSRQLTDLQWTNRSITVHLTVPRRNIYTGQRRWEIKRKQTRIRIQRIKSASLRSDFSRLHDCVVWGGGGLDWPLRLRNEKADMHSNPNQVNFTQIRFLSFSCVIARACVYGGGRGGGGGGEAGRLAIGIKKPRESGLGIRLKTKSTPLSSSSVVSLF